MALPISNTTSAAVVRAITGPVGGDALAKLLGAEIGTRMRGTVLAVLSDGSFTVDIKGATLRMQLPAATLPNTSVSFQLLSTKPGLTFLLDNKVAVATAAQPLAPVLAGGANSDSASNGVSISAAGKLVGDLLSASAASKEPLAIIGKTPVVAAAGAPPAALASGLRNTLEFSGVFYESHVGQWAAQDRTLAQLQREPQMAAASVQASTVDAPVLTAGQSAGGSAATSLAAPLGDTSIADPARIALQLHTLEQQHVEWRGDVWPGQSMKWEVQKDATDSPSGQDGAAPSWQSTVTFNLPSLGAVQAKLYLSEGHVRMALLAQTEDAAIELRAASASLGRSLSDAGTELDSIVVSVLVPGENPP